MKESLLSFGGVGSSVSAVAAAAPCCLPFLASVASTVGLSALLPYSAQIFGLLAVFGAFLSFRKHGKYGPLALTVVCFGALVVVYNISLLGWLLYSALVGLMVAAIWNTLEARRCNQCVAQA
jgi:hypothetical protein